MSKSTSLSEFIQNVKKDGLSKSNRYLVNFSAPKSVIMLNPSNIRTYWMFCDQIELPGITYATKGIRTFGEVRETPYDKASKEIMLSFYIDANLELKAFFDMWGNSIMDVNSRTWNYYDDFVTPTINIAVLNTAEQTVYTVTLFECYPKSIAPIPIGYANNDVMKLNVSMQYKYWTSQKSDYKVNGDILNTVILGNFASNLPIDTTGFVIPDNYFTLNSTFQKIVSGVTNPAGSIDTLGNLKTEIQSAMPFYTPS